MTQNRTVLEEEQMLRIELVAEEAFLNVVYHAYHLTRGSGDGRVRS